MRPQEFSDTDESDRERHGDVMKPAPAVPGNTELERFDNAVRKMFSVSKDDLAEQEAKWKRAVPAVPEIAGTP